MNQEIKYIGFYDIYVSSPKRVSSLSATNKMDYICDALHRSGYSVHLISPSWYSGSTDSWINQTTVQLATYKKLTLCPSIGTNNNFTLYIKIAFSLLWLLWYLMVNTKSGEPILVYNNTWLSFPVRLAKRFKRFRLILEVEEIFGDVWNIKTVLRRQEQKLLSSADSYIVVSDFLANKFKNTKCVVLYGAYSVSDYCTESSKISRDTDCQIINVVYAGSVDKIKYAASIAVECAKYLTNDYVVHILGYGNQVDIEKLNDEICEVNKILGRQACVFHGAMTGTQFSHFLYSCDIAINSQKEGSYMETAFPSKILTYLSHNIRVVSTRIDSVINSKLCSLVSFSSSDNPEDIAHSVKSINLTSEYNSIAVIKKLDEEFIKNIKELIGSHA